LARVTKCITQYKKVINDVGSWQKKRLTEDIGRMADVARDEEIRGNFSEELATQRDIALHLRLLARDYQMGRVSAEKFMMQLVELQDYSRIYAYSQ
jgi:hypothetical protein